MGMIEVALVLFGFGCLLLLLLLLGVGLVVYYGNKIRLTTANPPGVSQPIVEDVVDQPYPEPMQELPAPVRDAEPTEFSIGRTCDHCGRPLMESWTHCPYCGAPVHFTI